MVRSSLFSLSFSLSPAPLKSRWLLETEKLKGGQEGELRVRLEDVATIQLKANSDLIERKKNGRVGKELDLGPILKMEMIILTEKINVEV